MESFNAFNPDLTPVLYYYPRSHTPYRHDGRRFLLWPAYAYRVLAPQSVERQLNLFQRTVLGFYRARVTEASKIAARLRLDQQVIQFIHGELRGMGMVNPDGSLTQSGEHVLAAELDRLPDESEVIAGYVFQDPWRGKLWPRFQKSLEPVHIELNEKGFPILILGSRGNPHSFNAFFVRLDASALEIRPSPGDIVRASRLQARDARRGGLAETASRDVDEDDFVVDVPASGNKLSAVSFLNEEPQLVYLATYIYAPEYEVHQAEWYVCDPFGLGASAQLHQWIEQRAEKDHSLKKFVADFLLESLGEPETLEKGWQIIDRLARDEIHNRLGEAIQQYPFFDLLAAQERTYQEVLQQIDAPPRDKLEDVLVKAGKTLEGVFRFWHTRYASAGAWKAYNAYERRSRKETLDEIAARLGYTTPLPYSFSGVMPGQVRQAAESGGGTLGERAITALLAAHHNPEHPLHRLSATMPNFFGQIGELMRLRGKSAHETGEQITPELAVAQRDTVYRILAALLDLESQSNGGKHA